MVMRNKLVKAERIVMRFEDWTRLWEALASASQKDMQFFMGIEKPVTLYQSTLAYVDPTCPCQPGYEEWAFIDKAVPGHDEKGFVGNLSRR